MSITQRVDFRPVWLYSVTQEILDQVYAKDIGMEIRQIFAGSFRSGSCFSGESGNLFCGIYVGYA